MVKFLQSSKKMMLLIIAVSMSPAMAGAEPFKSPKALETEGFRDVFAQIAPNVYMAGQPSPDGLERAKALGVTRVINLRTSYEMDNREVVPFDEAAKVQALGMEYVHLPLGGPDTPYNPAAVDQLADALGDLQQPTLLHCTVAWRATHLWTAYLIEKQGWSFADAIKTAKQLNLGDLPLSGFLDRELTVVPADD